MMQKTARKARASVNGVLLLDKAAGGSSNDALIQAKRLFNARKAGHTGTLDPFATGLLPLCFGEATKFSQDLLEADKTYETVVHLGVRSTTGDTEGTITETCAVNVTEAQIEEVLGQFRGEIAQVPPMHSALKRDGKPLYEYARAGVTLEREARRVIIHALDVLTYRAPFLTLRVTCSKGTYIRVLGEDIGAALGCGAHLQTLRRTAVGGLTLAGAITLDALSQQSEAERFVQLAPVDALLSSFPRIDLDETLARRFLHGQRLALGKEHLKEQLKKEQPSTVQQPGRVRVYRETDNCLLGTAQLMPYGVLAPERLVATGVD